MFFFGGFPSEKLIRFATKLYGSLPSKQPGAFHFSFGVDLPKSDKSKSMDLGKMMLLNLLELGAPFSDDSMNMRGMVEVGSMTTIVSHIKQYSFLRLPNIKSHHF